MIAMIVAYSKNRVIGKDGKLPWHLSEDLKRFKELTTRHIVIMGRRTFESIGKELNDRINIVITSDKNFGHGFRASNLEDALRIAEEWTCDGYRKIFLIGGSRVFSEGLKFADVIYATEIHKDYEGDTFFPELSESWYRDKVECHEGYSFVLYRKNPVIELETRVTDIIGKDKYNELKANELIVLDSTQFEDLINEYKILTEYHSLLRSFKDDIDHRVYDHHKEPEDIIAYQL